jgi:hypothetical protein
MFYEVYVAVLLAVIYLIIYKAIIRATRQSKIMVSEKSIFIKMQPSIVLTYSPWLHLSPATGHAEAFYNASGICLTA